MSFRFFSCCPMGKIKSRTFCAVSFIQAKLMDKLVVLPAIFLSLRVSCTHADLRFLLLSLLFWYSASPSIRARAFLCISIYICRLTCTKTMHRSVSFFTSKSGQTQLRVTKLSSTNIKKVPLCLFIYNKKAVYSVTVNSSTQDE